MEANIFWNSNYSLVFWSSSLLGISPHKSPLPLIVRNIFFSHTLITHKTLNNYLKIGCLFLPWIELWKCILRRVRKGGARLRKGCVVIVVILVRGVELITGSLVWQGCRFAWARYWFWLLGFRLVFGAGESIQVSVVGSWFFPFDHATRVCVSSLFFSLFVFDLLIRI